MLTQHEKAVLGTLSHNRPFTAREVSEYTAYPEPGRPQINGPSLVKRLLRSRLLERVGSSRGEGLYFPTSAGWLEIES